MQTATNNNGIIIRSERWFFAPQRFVFAEHRKLSLCELRFVRINPIASEVFRPYDNEIKNVKKKAKMEESFSKKT
jgi:hypothetical protein